MQLYTINYVNFNYSSMHLPV